MSAQPSESSGSGIWAARQLLTPLRPLTIADYLAIDEIESGRAELVEGSIVMSPIPVPRHLRAQKRLVRQLDDQLPDHLEAMAESEIDLALSGPDGPGWCRRPDVVVAMRTAYDRIDRAGGMLAVSEVLLAVEILSPSSQRTDTVTKRAEYADAGIPHYWIVDLDDPVSMVAHHLAGEFGYADGGVVTGTYSATAPFPVELDLDALL